ncbi:hypothetical protein BT96DRAFT_1004206 [Gymnopus androsaceus JB14]|uniref:Uncharacterized protein n=1 Tax=Gymnopus androsaceus JB14 TaxID=1447944 RepID=A0A6A4GTF3_9AGAR|nr:hypothetical protein BT96DRAFT_1004206 [Gymnopus androsaceus JB14]
MDPLEVNPAYFHPSLFMAFPSGEVPPPYASTSSDTPSSGTCMLIVDMGNPFEEQGWRQRMIVTPHHGVLHPMLTPEHSPHLFQFPCSPNVCQSCQVSNIPTDTLRQCVIPNFPFIFPPGNWMPPEVAKIRRLRVECRQMFLEHLAPILHGGVWDGAPFQTQCSFRDAEDCLRLVLNPISDHGFSWENPLAMELLKSIASKSVTKLSGLPIPALHAMMNFHCVKYLHNIKLARLYAQRARASHSICDQALANLTMKLSIKADCIDPSISESTSQVSGNVEMSSLDPPEPPSA